MGLTIVEFVLEVEEVFAISIPDGDAELIVTPRDLVDYLLWRGGAPSDADSCRTQGVFYRLRQAIGSSRGIPWAAIRPSVPRAQVLPRQYRRPSWSRIRRR